MKIKLSDIINEQANLTSLMEVKMPAKVSYRIKRLIDKLTPILKTFNEKRNDLVKELGEKDEEKDTYTITDKEKEKEFYKKLDEILEVEEEVEFTPIKVEELGDVQLKASEIVKFVFE